MDFRGILISAMALMPAMSLAATDAAGRELPAEGKVTIEYPVETALPYRERRPRHQFTAHVQYENFAPTGYLSPVIADPSTVDPSYQNVYNQEDIPLIGLALGYKFNMPFLGVEVAPFYAAGGITSSRTGENITLNFEKYGVRFAAYFETLFREPYVVPYVSGVIQVWGIEESGATLAFSRSTASTFGFGAGLLFQLNWLDPAAALLALNESGLNNTYLDVFVQQYGDTVDANDPVLSTDFNWGAGIRLEY